MGFVWWLRRVPGARVGEFTKNFRRDLVWLDSCARRSTGEAALGYVSSALEASRHIIWAFMVLAVLASSGQKCSFFMLTVAA
jgi:hypothetical protein